MFCPRCGRPIDEGAQFCPSCGFAVSGPGTPLASSASPSPPLLLAASRLVLVYDKLSMMANFQFQDLSGRLLGTTQGEVAFPLKYTLVDDRQQVVLSLDATRVRGLLYDYLIHDATGRVLASIHQESSFMSRKYQMSVNGQADWLLTTDASGYHYEIRSAPGGVVVATGQRKPALRTSTTQLEITEGQPLDHRIILGAMILLCYFTRK